MAKKRKTTLASSTAGAKKRKTTPSENTSPFRLLDLPPELRNNIYGHILADGPQAYLRSSKRGELTCKSALARTNRQIRKELLSLLHITTTAIVAEVKNLDFSHIVTFFNRLDERDLEALPTTKNLDPTSEYKLVINIDITRYCLDAADWDKLLRWLRRLDHPTKKGADIVTTYKVNYGTHRQVRDFFNPSGPSLTGSTRFHQGLRDITKAVQAAKTRRGYL